MPSLVLHVDMDAFFASVEIRSDPRLEGKPLVVGGGPGPRGVVTTASYAARAYGIRSGMPLFQARRLCPGLLFVGVDPPKYIHESLRVLSILDRFSPRVEAASIDEAYLEFPPVDSIGWRDTAHGIGHSLRAAVREGTGLPCTVGAGVNKLQAKMATRLGKPDGLHALLPGSFLLVFGNSPVSVVPGIGLRTTAALHDLGIRTVRDLATADPRRLAGVFGSWARLLGEEARGVDPRPLLARGEEPEPKSASHEITFSRDEGDPRMLRATVWMLSDRVARRLRRHGMLAVTVAVRWKRGQSRRSHQRRLSMPTDDPREIALAAWELLESARGGASLRLIGVAGLSLWSGEPAPSLFPEQCRRRVLLQVGDRIRDRFGETLLLPGGVFREGSPTR